MKRILNRDPNGENYLPLWTVLGFEIFGLGRVSFLIGFWASGPELSACEVVLYCSPKA